MKLDLRARVRRRPLALLSLAVATLLVALLASPATAGAALVFRNPGSTTLQFEAGAGERNDVSITLAAGTYTITDRGPGVTVGTLPPCTSSADPQTVTCPADGIDRLSLDVASLDDQVSIAASTQAFMLGGDGNDALTGGGGADQVFGQLGVDTVNGGAGDDVLHGDDFGTFSVDRSRLDGGPGRDDLVGGAGPDSLQGGADDDTLQGFSGADSGDGGSGDDLVTGGDGNDALAGGAGNDRVGSPQESLFGTPPERGDDRLDGGAGDDVVRPGAGPAQGVSDADVLTGGSGRDTVTYEQRAVELSVSLDGSANDGSAGERDNVGLDVERLVGGASDDRLTGGAAADEIDGSGGADLIEGGGGNDTLDGGAADAESDTLAGGAGADLLRGNAGDDALRGGDGGDTLEGGGGDDALEGGADPDELVGGNGVDDLAGGRGNDRLNGSAPGPVGLDGGDTLRGDDGDDLLAGGDGDDRLVGGRGADDMRGGAGTDSADYGISNRPVTVTLDDVANDGHRGERDNVRPDVENIVGGAVDDTFTGSRRANRLGGGGGEDYLDGARGRDDLRGGSDVDVVRARDRGIRDTVSCGRGRDFAIVGPEDRVSRDCEAFDDGRRTVPSVARTVVIEPVRRARFGPPGMRRTVPLGERLKVPVESQLDTTDGSARLVSARERRERQSARISGGRVEVLQRRSRRPTTELRLSGGDFGRCGPASQARSAGAGRHSATQAQQRRRRIRRLRVRARGRFRVRGRSSSATVRGTVLAVEDRCDGTLTRVSEGVVQVRDFVRRRTVIVRAGETYLARAAR